MANKAELIAEQLAQAAGNSKIWGDILYNVKVYGAKGDGIADDTAAIQSAINAAAADGGGVVLLPPGAYLISSTLLINKPGISLRGSSTNSSILISRAATGDIIKIGANPAFVYAEVRDLQITASVARTSGYAIAVDGCENYNFENLLLFRSSSLATGGGLHFNGTSGLGFIRSIDIEIVGAFNGVYVENGNDRYFSQMWIRGSKTAGSNGIFLEGSGGDWFTDVESVQFETGVHVSPKVSNGVSWTKMHNVLADTNNMFGFLFDGSGNVQAIELDACWIGTTGPTNLNARGLMVLNADTLMATDLRVLNTGGHGIEIGSSAKNIQLKGGVITSSSLASAGLTHGIVTQTNFTGGLIVMGMEIGQSAGQTNMQGNGILINAGNDNYTIIGNDLTGNLSAGLNDSSLATATNSIVNSNRGYKSESGGRATFSGTGAQTQFSIPHGLAAAPIVYVVTAGSPAATALFFIGADATNITVTFNAAPATGSNNVELQWVARIK